ncbi:MAG: transcription antitermination factor NusB [Phycisphaerales bacterium]|nr:transcription antitermination factor NusB [Phycisphaerales bacterium]
MSVPSDVRSLAYEHLFALETPAGSPDDSLEAAAMLERLPPDQRLRAIWIASRRLAVQLLYQLDAQADARTDAQQDILRTLGRVPDLGPIQAQFVAELVLGAFRERQQTDAAVRELAPTWPAHRQPAVDRAILRLACYELRRADSPPKVVINEAVELAKRFSTDKSATFVNGILGKIYRTVAGGDVSAAEPETNPGTTSG